MYSVALFFMAFALGRLVYRYISSLHLFAFLKDDMVEKVIDFDPVESTAPFDVLLKDNFPEVEPNSLFYRITIRLNGEVVRIVYMTKSGPLLHLYYCGAYRGATMSAWLWCLKVVESPWTWRGFWSGVFSNEELLPGTKVSSTISLGWLRPRFEELSFLRRLCIYVFKDLDGSF